MEENARLFGGESVLRNAVVVVKPGLSRPADMESGEYGRFRPRHDAAQLVPVVHVLEIEVFDGRAGDDQTVETLVLHVVERAVEGLHVFLGRVLRLVRAGAQKRQFDLEGRVRQKTDYLRLSRNFRGHKVQNGETQRTDVLSDGAPLVHDEYVFFLERVPCGQLLGYLDRQLGLSPLKLFPYAEPGEDLGEDLLGDSSSVR